MKRSPRRAFYQLMAGNLLIMAVVFAVAGVVSYRSLDAQYLRETAAHQYQLASFADELVQRVWPLPDGEMDRLCKQLAAEATGLSSDAAGGRARALPVRLTVIAADGRVLGDSRSDPAQMANHKTPDRPEVLRALEGQPGQDTRRSETLGVPYRYIAVPVVHGNEVVAAARVALPVVAISQGESVIQETILWTMVTAVVVFALVGLLVNWIWYKSLRAGTTAANGDEEE